MKQPGPYLGILRPWAQENFAPPPLFVRIQLCVSKKTQKTDKRQNIIALPTLFSV
jgi:predicted nucleic acid binding AN1-type Zn finger protein